MFKTEITGTCLVQKLKWGGTIAVLTPSPPPPLPPVAMPLHLLVLLERTAVRFWRFLDVLGQYLLKSGSTMSFLSQDMINIVIFILSNPSLALVKKCTFFFRFDMFQSPKYFPKILVYQVTCFKIQAFKRVTVSRYLLTG